MLAGILAKRRKLAPRLLIEITETAAITDLEAAGKAIAALRAHGLSRRAGRFRRRRRVASIICTPSRSIS